MLFAQIFTRQACKIVIYVQKYLPVLIICNEKGNAKCIWISGSIALNMMTHAVTVGYTKAGQTVDAEIQQLRAHWN